MWPAPVAEMGAMLPPAKECQQPPDAGRGKEGFPVEPPGGAESCPCSDLTLLTARAVRESVPCNSPVLVAAARVHRTQGPERVQALARVQRGLGRAPQPAGRGEASPPACPSSWAPSPEPWPPAQLSQPRADALHQVRLPLPLCPPQASA